LRATSAWWWGEGREGGEEGRGRDKVEAPRPPEREQREGVGESLHRLIKGVFDSTPELQKTAPLQQLHKFPCQTRLAPSAPAPKKRWSKGVDPHFSWSTSRGAPKTLVMYLLMELVFIYPPLPLVTYIPVCSKKIKKILCPSAPIFPLGQSQGRFQE
jgi:hypothetical protein